MSPFTKEITILGAAVAAGILVSALSLSWWRNSSDPATLLRRVAQPDELPTAVSSTSPTESVEIGKYSATFQGTSAPSPGAWPGFRGANHNNIATPDESLAASWPTGGPPVLWSVALGEGYAGPAIQNGRAYLLDYDAKENADSLRCFSMEDGREIWRRWYKVHIKRNHGISRTVPAVSRDFVVTIGPRCHVMCVETETGAFRWGLDLVKDWGTTEPMWYTGQCPLMISNQVILAVGGKVLLMGIDCATGKTLWQTPNPKNWQMSHACVTPMTWQGKKMYVYAAIGGIIGVSAEAGEEGKILWETTEWNHQVVAPTPVPLDDGRFLVTAGYGAGSALFKLAQESGTYSVQQESRLEKTTFACEQHTPIYYKGFLYSILPADAGGSRKQAVCMDPYGKIMWRSGPSEQFGLGPFMIADNKLLLLEDNGKLTLAEASEKGFIKLAQAKVLTGKEAWAPMALADGRLLVRDYGQMKCLDVGISRPGNTPHLNPLPQGERKQTVPLPSVPSPLVGEGQGEGFVTYKPSLSNLTALAVDKNDRIIVGSMSAIELLDPQGTHLTTIPLTEPVRCLATSAEGDIYVGLNDHIEVFTPTGTRLAVWESPAPNTMLTSLAVSSNNVYAADCGNRIVWQYSRTGTLIRQIGKRDQDQRKEGFVVPSPYFDLAVAADESLWVVNPGEHRLEHYTADGKLLTSWGHYAIEDAGFCGCCNPSHIALTPSGDFITSEKHIVRIKHYDANGQLKAVLSSPTAWPEKAVGLDLTVDSKGRILALDPTTDSIRIFQPRNLQASPQRHAPPEYRRRECASHIKERR